MKAFSARLGIALTFGLLCSTFLSAEGSFHRGEESASIRNVIDTFVQAWNQSDAETLIQLFTEDGEFTSPSHAVAKRRSEIQKLVPQERESV